MPKLNDDLTYKFATTSEVNIKTNVAKLSIDAHFSGMTYDQANTIINGLHALVDLVKGEDAGLSEALASMRAGVVS